MAKKEVIKNLSIAELKKQQKKLTKVEEGFVKLDNEDYKFTYDVIFRKTKQGEVLEELVSFMNEYIEQEEYMNMIMPYAILLTIKHFTNIEISDDVDEAMDYMKIMIDLDIFYSIFEALPTAQVEELMDSLTVQFELIGDNMAKELEKIQESTEDKDETE